MYIKHGCCVDCGALRPADVCEGFGASRVRTASPHQIRAAGPAILRVYTAFNVQVHFGMEVDEHSVRLPICINDFHCAHVVWLLRELAENPAEVE